MANSDTNQTKEKSASIKVILHNLIGESQITDDNIKLAESRAKTFSERFAICMWRLKFTPRSLATTIDTKVTNINQWLNGGALPNTRDLIVLNTSGFDINYLLTGRKSELPTYAGKNLDIEDYLNLIPVQDKTHMLKLLLSGIHAAMFDPKVTTQLNQLNS